MYITLNEIQSHVCVKYEWMLHDVRKRVKPAAGSLLYIEVLKYMAVALLVHCKVYIET